tara:strand:- start:809 stop:1021 length:213 start_codon:yes stop_codon:yes gene_type:complete
MSSIHDNLEVLTKEEIMENNVKTLQKQLNNAHTRIHKLHDVINEMKHLSQQSVDNLVKSVDISYDRWEEM